MGDILRLIEIIDEYPAIWVAFVFTLFALIGLWREVIVTRGRHEEIVRERDWWRERAERLEQELREDDEHRDRVITALQQIADVMHLLVPPEKTNWLSRWIP